jgi:rubrerythrin
MPGLWPDRIVGLIKIRLAIRFQTGYEDSSNDKEEGMSTEKNLKEAFAGESQANRMYLAFAKKAESDGYPQVAKLFRAAAAAETVHAHAHFRVMGGVKDTAANLRAAISGEGYEFQNMYPDFLKEAEAEKNVPASVSFRNALAVEKIHHDLYSQALESIRTGKDLAGRDIFVCEVCGNTVYGHAPDTCPVCGAEKAKFTRIP